MKKEKEVFESDFTRDFETILIYADVPFYRDYKFVINNFDPEGSVDYLDLGVRAENALKRNKIFTFGQLLTADLHKIRGCGNNTIREIRTKFLSFFYGKMSDLQRIKFWKDTYALTAEAHKAPKEEKK